MTIKNYSVGDEHAILKLFELSFNKKISLDQWKWRFEFNPAGKRFIKLMWDGELLIGHYAISPIILNIDGKLILTAHSLTTMTHPNYTGKGIFKKLSQELYSELEDKLNFRAIWGFPNTNSHYGFIKNLKWKDISVIHTLGISISKFNNVDPISLNRINGFNSNHVRFLEKSLKGYSIKIERSLDYLNWRYFQKPSTQYQVFEWRESGELKGIAVTKIYQPSTFEGIYDINILEFELADYSNLKPFLKTIILNYSEKLNRITIWKNLFDSNHIFFEKAGFYPVLPYTYLAARCENKLHSYFTNIQKWYFSLGDSDVY